MDKALRIDLRHPFNNRAQGIPPPSRGANQARAVKIEALVQHDREQSGWDLVSGLPVADFLKKFFIAG